jgi:hypothetical protein
MPELADDSLKVTEEFEVPADAKPSEAIPSVVQSESMRENSVLALSVEVPIAEFNKRLEGALKQLRKSASVPGFRKGKVPEGAVAPTLWQAVGRRRRARIGSRRL